MVLNSSKHANASITAVSPFRKRAPWLIGIACLVLMSIQMTSNLASVHRDQSRMMLYDAPDYPDLLHIINFKQRNSKSNSTMASSGKSQLVVLPSNTRKEFEVEHGVSMNAENTASASSSTSSWSIDTSYLYASPEFGQIRRWGCRLSTVPFIFVHIGKTGGGNVRARLAASSLNYTKIDFRHQDFSYYPLNIPPLQRRQRRRSKYDDEDRAQFCNSGYHMFKPQPRGPRYRRVLQCNATTPLGQAIACPELFHHAYDPNRTRIMAQRNMKSHEDENVNATIIANRNALRYRRHPCFCPPNSDHAHVVFVGHHNFGTEMHWLPATLLLEWWNTHWAPKTTITATTHAAATAQTTTGVATVKAANDDQIAQRLQSLQTPYDISSFPNHYADDRDDHEIAGRRTSWCHGRPRPIFAYDDSAAFHQSCSQELYQPMDQLAREAVQRRMSQINQAALANTHDADAATILTESTAMAAWWSTVYASLPVLRVTILRDPFSWLCSKFFWHKTDELFNITCDDAAIATDGDWMSIRDKKRPNGWARRMALLYLEQICGADCVVRSYYSTSGSMLRDIELQATANLRQGFAVVGILPDLDDFYDMLNRRMYYLNTSLNPQVEGMRHGSFSTVPEEAERCKKLYLYNRTFQEQMLQAPEIAALYRVYQVGVEVNQFQRKELEHC